MDNNKISEFQSVSQKDTRVSLTDSGSLSDDLKRPQKNEERIVSPYNFDKFFEQHSKTINNNDKYNFGIVDEVPENDDKSFDRVKEKLSTILPDHC